MGERISFATTQWKDKPGKPDCMTQAEWDAMNSSKFNGAPFNGSLAPGIFYKDNKYMISGYDKDEIDTFVDEINALPTHPICDGRGNGFREIVQPQPKEIEVPCEKIKAAVWDGSTYYDLTDTLRVMPPKSSCWWPDAIQIFNTFSLLPPTGAGLADVFFPRGGGKYPSASSDMYIPVCGTQHIKEISRDKAVEAIWRISQLDITASAMNLSADYEINILYSDTTAEPPIENCPDTYTSNAVITFGNKNLDPTPSGPGLESDILKLKWDTTNETGYTGIKSMPNSVDNSNDNSNGNLTLTATEAYSCNATEEWPGSKAQCSLTLKPFDKRHEAFFFINDKVYLDITKLFNFRASFSPARFVFNQHEDHITEYTLDPGNINAEFQINVIFLGVTFIVKVRGPKNYSGKTRIYPNNEEYSRPVQSASMSRSFTGGTININAKKYYPYANSQGENVYNEDTGQQLVGPLS